jgi:hypothetical protein
MIFKNNPDKYAGHDLNNKVFINTLMRLNAKETPTLVYGILLSRISRTGLK